MKRTILKDEFLREMAECGWTRNGAELLYDALIEIEEAHGEELEFDPIALNCDLYEYRSIEEAAEDYGESADDLEEHILARDEDSGLVIVWIH